MGIVLNIVLLLLINIINTYIASLFLNFFFVGGIKKRRVSYVLCAEYCVLSCLKAFFVTAVIPDMLLSLLLISMLTLCYKAKIADRMLAVVSAASFFLICEIFIKAMTGIDRITLHHLADYIYYGTKTALLACIIQYSFVQVISRFRNLHKKVKTPKGFLVITIAVPIVSVCLEVLLLLQKDVSDVIYYVLLICVILLNFTASYLYDFIDNLFREKARSAAAEQKSVYYRQEAELMQRSSREIQELRHDMKNHLLAISELARTQDNAQITDYTDKLLDKMMPQTEYSRTGMIPVDSIINYKLSQAEQAGIRVSSDIAVPEEIRIEADDLVTVIGNLLDNAVEAVSKRKDDKYISLSMKFQKGSLLITLKNSFDGILKMKNDRYLTTKNDPKQHGIGLQSIETVIRKYNGEMIARHSDSEFVTKIIMIV